MAVYSCVCRVRSSWLVWKVLISCPSHDFFFSFFVFCSIFVLIYFTSPFYPSLCTFLLVSLFMALFLIFLKCFPSSFSQLSLSPSPLSLPPGPSTHFPFPITRPRRPLRGTNAITCILSLCGNDGRPQTAKATACVLFVPSAVVRVPSSVRKAGRFAIASEGGGKGHLQSLDHLLS